MFGKAFKIGTILGFRIEISFTFVFILAYMFISMGLVQGALVAILVFSSVLAHELGHAVVARRLGITINGIELHLLGGAAKMARMPKTARDEIVIAIAGPLVSMGLGVGALMAYLASGWIGFGAIAFINLMLGVFNLLPALPMDGGRVLRAALSKRIGRYRATHAAASVAQVIAVALPLVGLVLKQTGVWNPSIVWLVLLGVLLFIMAGQERRMAAMWRYEDEMPQAEVLDEYGRVVSQPQGPGVVYNIPNPANPSSPAGPPGGPVAQGPPGQGTKRRVIRLPNGMVMVVEEYRW